VAHTCKKDNVRKKDEHAILLHYMSYKNYKEKAFSQLDIPT